MTLGANESVCSWICVVAWNTEMRKPTSRLISTGGAETMSTRKRACCRMELSWCMRVSQVADDQALGDEVPAIDEDEEQQLEGHGDGGGRQHVHAQRQQDVGHHHVDDDERHEEQEAYLEGFLEFGHHEGRDDHHEVLLGEILAVLLRGPHL